LSAIFPEAWGGSFFLPMSKNDLNRTFFLLFSFYHALLNSRRFSKTKRCFFTGWIGLTRYANIVHAVT